MIDILNSGGWVMYCILACSIVSLAVAIERTIVFRASKFDTESFLDTIKPHLDLNSTSKAAEICRGENTPPARIAETFLLSCKMPAELIDENLYRTGLIERQKLEKRLSILAVLGRLTPLMGLLGTVLGMITVFRKIQELSGQADASHLAGGIWEALLTTAFGLSVAIPVILVLHIFERIANERTEKLESFITDLKNVFSQEAKQTEGVK